MTLVGWWKLDVGAGTSAADESGNGYTGTLTGGAGWSDGKIGNAVSLDGTDDYVEVNSARASIQSAASLSASFWIRPTVTFDSSHTTNDMMFSLADAPSTNDFTFKLAESDGALDFRHIDSAGLGFDLSPASPVSWLGGRWYHIVGTFDSTAKKVYVNGAQGATIGTNLTRGTTLSTQLNIGRHFNGQYFAGSIDDVRIYDHALTADEVRALYTGGFGRRPGFQRFPKQKRKY